MDCSSIIWNGRYEAIYIYTWREVNARDWNSSTIKARYQNLDWQYEKEKEKAKA